jgi:NAD(P)-dependent dehydrogenase (short-subunit alcohol dehydrogenase family)
MDGSKIRALVTGASRGIGQCITRKLLSNNAAVIGTRNQTPFPKAFLNHTSFEPMRVDLADLGQVKKGLKPIFKWKRPPNVLINNAGINEVGDLECDDESWLKIWDKTQQVNLKTPVLLSKWAINCWKKEEGGILVNIASRAAYRGDTQEFAAYAASKAGLVAFTKSMARDFGKHNIAAYSIAPGFTKTDMATNSIEVYGEDYLTKDSAFGEITSPEEVAELVVFLSTGKVKHMTGTTFHINGGSYMI